MAERSTTTLDPAGTLVISRPEEAGSETIEVSAGQPISFDFDLGDATVTQSGGDIVLTFADRAEITLVSGAGAGGFGGTLFEFSDGIVVTESALVSSPAAASSAGETREADTGSQVVDKPDAGETVEVTVQAGQPISFAFDIETAEVIQNDNDVVILFEDGAQITLVSVLAGVAADAPPLVLLNDGSLVTPQEILDLRGGGDALASGLSDIATASGSSGSPGVSPLPTPPPEDDEPEIDNTPLAGPPEPEPEPAPPPPPPVTAPPLFTQNTDTVDFNQLVQGSFADGTAYNALGGDDNVILFDSADAAAAVGFDITVTFDAGAGDDTITGGGLDDIIFGGTGADTITGGGGSDTVDTGSGDDVGVFAADPGGGSFSDGGDGTDTLIVNLTADNFQDPAMVQELTALRDFIRSESTEPATFEQLGITVANWEDVTILLDGEPVDLDAALPSLTVEAASGDEDSAIALDIEAELTDTDGSEVLSVTIADIPDGAVLSVGIVNEDGSVTLTPDQLAGLTITPLADSSDDFTLAITATTQEQSTGDTASVTASLDVSVVAVADTPTSTTTAASGDEDTAIALDISSALTGIDGSETLSVTITGIPAGAVLSTGTVNLDGSVTLTPDQLAGLTITPPADSDVDFTLSVTATSTDGSDTASTTASLAVTVAAVADTPTLTTTAASGDEDSAIALDISSALTDIDGSETLSVTITGIPAGAILSVGNVNEDSSVTLTPDQLADLTITPPENSADDFTLSVTATSTDGSDTASTTASLLVTIAAEGAPTLAVEAAAGDEDTAIALDIAAGLTDTAESAVLSVTIADIPDGAVLSAGTLNPDGSVTLTLDQLAGLTITPPADSDVDFTLTITASSTDGADISTRSAFPPVTVAAVADAPILSVQAASGDEDNAIGLDISSALTDIDGSEVLSVTIAGVPDGAVLSAGTVNLDGTVTLTPDQLTGLTITPATDSSGDFTLSVTATSTDGADTATATASLDVSVGAVANTPILATEAASGDEDSAIPLDISAALTDGSKTLSVIITGIPAGAVLSAGTLNLDGSVTLTPDQLAGFTITPPADSDVDFTLSVTATSTDGSDTASTTASLDVTVAAVADTPTLTTTAASGDEDTAIALDISSALADLDGSEALEVTITGIPDGATLSAGIVNDDGSVTLTPDQLAGLTITPPADSDVDFTLSVTATSTDGADTASTTASLSVTVAAVADAPTLSVQAASGDEGSTITLEITSALTDIDGSETLEVIIAGIPDGATLSAGIVNDAGSVTLTPDQLAGLTITPVADIGEDFTLTVTATSTDGSDTATTTASLAVSVVGDDAPILTVEAAAGDEDSAIALDIAAALTDTDESAVLSVTIADIPDGAVLSAGTLNPDGSVTLTPDQLAGLTITPAADSDTDFTLSVTANSTDGEDLATTTAALSVAVAAVADAPILSVKGYPGVEDNEIIIDIAASLTDLDGSESLSVTITGIPDGAVLSAGTVNPDGSVTLNPYQLIGLTILPPADSDVDFTLSVTATSTEADGGDSATTTVLLPVTVNDAAPDLIVEDASGDQDTAIPLAIAAASDVLSVTIDGIPVGAALSAGIVNPDGSVTLTPAQLANLTITPPGDSDVDFTLTIDSISTGGTFTVALPVSVAAVADAPNLTVSVGEGTPQGGDIPPFDQAISNIVLYVQDDTGNIQKIRVLDFPGADSAIHDVNDIDINSFLAANYPNVDLVALTVKAGNNTTPGFGPGEGELFILGDNFLQADLPVAPHVDDNDSYNFGDEFNGEIEGIFNTGGSGTEFPLEITAALTDTDGSETLSVTVGGIPVGAVLSAGTLNPDGSVTLTPGELAGLTITLPEDSSADFTLIVTATSTEGDGGDSATTTALLPVTVADDSGAVLVHTNGGSRAENQNCVLVSDMDADSVTVVGAGDLTADSSPDLWRVEEGGGDRAATQDDFDGAQYASVDQGDRNDWVAAAAGVQEDLVIDLSEGAWTSTEFAAGGLGDDILTGNSARNLLIGGDGNDTFFGSENRDILLGGAGDDTFIIEAAALTDNVLGHDITIGDLSQEVEAAIAANNSDGTEIASRMRSGIDGGSGNDTLRIVADEDVTIDLGSGDFGEATGAVDNIEAIDLRQGAGDITLRLDLNDVIDLTDDANELRVFRDAGDQVEISDDAVASAIGAEVDGFVTFTFLDDAGSELAKVHVQADPPAM